MSKPLPPSGPNLDDIDVEAELERAFAELDSKIPDGYFDTFSSKVAASLEREASMHARRPDVLTSETPTPPPAERDEHSGLHEIKALAQNARSRIKRRRSSESDVEQAMLSSSSSALSAVVLPDPESETRIPEPIAAQASEPIASLPPASKGVPTWLWAAGGTALVAAAAAAALFVFSRNGSGDEASGEQAVAVADQAPAQAAAPAETAPPPAPEPSVASLAADSEEDAEPEPEPADEPEIALEGAATETKSDEAATGSSETRSGGARPAPKRARERAAVDTAKAREVKKPDPDETKGGESEEKPGRHEATGDIDDLLDQVAGPDLEKKKQEEEKAERKVDKKRLGSGDIRTAMRSVTGAVNACQKKTGFLGRVSVKFSVSPSGAVGRVNASGGNSAVHSCVAAAVKKARFPTFEPPAMSFRYSFLLSD